METTFRNDAGTVAFNARAYMYHLLSNLYAGELSRETIVGFQDSPAKEVLEAMGNVAHCPQAIPRLKAAFAKLSNPEQHALDLAEAYAWLFHGVGGPHGAPPYASVYLSENGNTFQAPEAGMRHLLQEHGLSFARLTGEPCDHIAVILAFVAWLCDRAEAEPGGDKWLVKQRYVIEQYLLTWLPEFVDQCQRGDRHGFYAALAKDTLEIAAADYAGLTITVDQQQRQGRSL